MKKNIEYHSVDEKDGITDYEALFSVTYEHECRILIGYLYRKREAMAAVLEYIQSVNTNKCDKLRHIESIINDSLRTDDKLNNIEKEWLHRHRKRMELLLLHNPSLTKEELNVCVCILDNLTNEEISSQLYRSVKTIDSYRQSIRRKLNISGGKNTMRNYLLSIIRNNEEKIGIFLGFLLGTV